MKSICCSLPISDISLTANWKPNTVTYYSNANRAPTAFNGITSQLSANGISGTDQSGMYGYVVLPNDVSTVQTVMFNVNMIGGHGTYLNSVLIGTPSNSTSVDGERTVAHWTESNKNMNLGPYNFPNGLSGNTLSFRVSVTGIAPGGGTSYKAYCPINSITITYK